MNIGENIRKIRKSKKLTLKELGLKVKLSEQAIGQYERGNRTPGIEILNKIAIALEIDINDLLGSNKEELKKNFKEVSKMTTIEREIETLNHIEEIFKISEAIGYENCLKYFRLLTTDEKIRFSQDLRKFMSQHLKTYIYINRRYETLPSNEKSKFEVLDSETIEAINQTLTFS